MALERGPTYYAKSLTRTTVGETPAPAAGHYDIGTVSDAGSAVTVTGNAGLNAVAQLFQLFPNGTATMGSAVAAGTALANNKGWIIPVVASMGGSPAALRFLPAGSTLSLRLRVRATGVAGTDTISFTVYKRSSTGVLTQIKTASADITNGPTGNQANVPVAIAVATEQTFSTGETLYVECYISVLGQTVTAGTAACGLDGTVPWDFNTPQGITYRYSSLVTDTAPASDASDRQLFLPRALTDTTAITDIANRFIIYVRGLPESALGVDTLSRQYLAARALTDTTSVVDAIARGLVLTRGLTDSAFAVPTLATAFKGARTLTEALTYSDVAGRGFFGNRSVSDTVVTSDSINRFFQAIRAISESVPIGTSVVSRSTIMTRNLTESIPMTDSIQRLLTYVRGIKEYPPGVTPDYQVTFPTKVIAGIVRNSDGTTFTAGATVLLVRDTDSKVVQTQTSAANGSYSFVRDTYDPYTYRIEALETSTPTPQQGSTPAGLVPA